MVTRTAGNRGKAELFQEVQDAVLASGWKCLVLDSNHPFGLRVFKDDQVLVPLRVYIWNCTPGGKSRAHDEWRIQFTGDWPTPHAGEITLLLGWHEGFGVFAGWNVRHHTNQTGKSPSTQIKEGTLEAAASKTFSTQAKGNAQVVVAFQPQFFVDYATAADALHGSQLTKADLVSLDDLSSVDDAAIAAIPDTSRRLIVGRIVRHYRAYDFRRRVLGAYRHRCAFCAVQLDLLDAAHILPVAAPASTDRTSNGIALCKIHHAAFDGNLISFNDAYRIEVSSHQSAVLRRAGLSGGLSEFTTMLKPTILLPSAKRDAPVPALIVEARTIRGWRL